MTRQMQGQERFWSKVVAGESGCLVWTAARMSNGYGKFGAAPGDIRLAHRWAYENRLGPIPPGLDLDHLCRNRACVNPFHLEPVSRRENLRRSPLHPSGRTECPQGHSYDDVNTYVDRFGWRHCKVCAITRQTARRARLKREAA